MDLDPEPSPHCPVCTLASHTVLTRPWGVGGMVVMWSLRHPRVSHWAPRKCTVLAVLTCSFLTPCTNHLTLPHGSYWEAPVWPGHFRTWCSADSMEDSGWQVPLTNTTPCRTSQSQPILTAPPHLSNMPAEEPYCDPQRQGIIICGSRECGIGPSLPVLSSIPTLPRVVSTGLCHL